MTHTNRSLLVASAPLAALLLVAGCSTRTDVSATGSTPPQFTKVYITTQAIWLNASATAGPDDSGWTQYPLSTPVTVDLIQATNGKLERIIGGLTIAPGTYRQIRLIPVPYSSTPSAAAQTAGAKYDQEVDYVDSSRTTQQVALQILNPDKGISIPGNLNVPFAKLGGSLGAPTRSSNTGSLFGSTNSSSPGTASSGAQSVNFAINFNGATDIALIYYPSGPQCTPNSTPPVTTGCSLGAVLNPHASAYDLSQVGGISGQLAITLPNGYTNASDRLNISATAESLSADGSRHVQVLSAPVKTDGSFRLYPLPATTDTAHPTTYDVVIHGAGIETMIVKGVQVTLSSTSATTSSSSSSATADTSLGWLTPVAAGSYTVNITPTQATLPAGAALAFYQTLPGSNEVPYVIETAAIDPLNGTLVLPQPLSSGQVESATYSTTQALTTTVSATGQTLTLTSADPLEKAGTYRVGGIASLFAEAPMISKVSAPSSSSSSSSASSTADVLATPDALQVESGAAAATISATVTVSQPGTYNAGVLFVSQGGTIIASKSLNDVLAQGGGPIQLTGLPGGSLGSPFAPARYYLSTLVWNTGDPTSLTPQSFPTVVDLREGSVSGVQVPID
jgi:hypothetical protein